MTIYADYVSLPQAAKGHSIALGNFDGLHAGHLAVIDTARQAAAGQAPLGVATFEPPPRAYFRPQDAPFRILAPEVRNRKILDVGKVDTVFELPFNANMAGMTDEQFARDVLHEGLGARHVTVGFDFRFGRGRMGDADRLASLGRALGFGVSVVEEVQEGGSKASSTAIRHALRVGEPERAARMLGHPWSVSAVVEHGEKRGRTLGFPTANMHLHHVIHPRHGVYAVRARIAGEDAWRDGIANFGRTPTTGLRDPLLETVLFDFDGDLYGKTLEVALIAFLRPEAAFASVEAMIDQMHGDVTAAKRVLSASGG
ncbi:MAG: riboflavin biosynthesis protein RibF [Pseudomonadota bacterium]